MEEAPATGLANVMVRWLGFVGRTVGGFYWWGKDRTGGTTLAGGWHRLSLFPPHPILCVWLASVTWGYVWHGATWVCARNLADVESNIPIVGLGPLGKGTLLPSPEETSCSFLGPAGYSYSHFHSTVACSTSSSLLGCPYCTHKFKGNCMDGKYRPTSAVLGKYSPKTEKLEQSQ